MIGGYECESCKTGGAKKKPVKRRKGGNALLNAFNSAVQNIKMGGGAKNRKVKRGGNTEGEAQEEQGTTQGSEMAGGARKRKVRRVRKGGSESEEFEQEMDGGAKRKRKVRRVRRGGSDVEEFETELVGGAKKRKGAKKALNPYIKFVKKHFQSMKKQYPNDTAPQVMKKIAVEYKKQK